MKYLKLWLKYTMVATQIALQSRFGALLFLIGKTIRFVVFFYFIYLIVSKTNTLAGYTLWQVIFFYATFNLIDSIPNLLLREVYRFRSYVIKGSLDYILTKPQSALFRSLFGGTDILDLPILLITIGLLIYSSQFIGPINLINGILFLVLLVNALILAFVFHILVLCLGILTTEVDNSIMLYRDLSKMGQIPVDVYRFPISFVITFVIPIGIMMSFPVKALLGVLSYQFIIYSIIFSLVFLYLSLKFWGYALNKYQSASS